MANRSRLVGEVSAGVPITLRHSRSETGVKCVFRSGGLSATGGSTWYSTVSLVSESLGGPAEIAVGSVISPFACGSFLAVTPGGGGAGAGDGDGDGDGGGCCGAPAVCGAKGSPMSPTTVVSPLDSQRPPEFAADASWTDSAWVMA
jgi:hypothetical protein